MGTAILILDLVPRAAVLLVIAGYGFMLGVSIPAVNVAASLRSPGREMAQLNLLNTAWCLGAVLAPPAIVSLSRAAGMGAVLALIGALCLLSGAACLLFLERTIVTHLAAGERPKIGKTIRRAAVATGLFLFLYVGVENGLNGWMPLLAQRTHAGTNTGAAALSVFWAAILLSRLMAGLLSGQRESRIWLRSGLVLATLGVAAVIAFQRMPALFLLGSAAAGLGMGPLFPTAVALFHARAGAASERLMGLVFAASGCGGGALPWLIGLISSATGSLRIGLAVALAALAGMIFVQVRADYTTSFRTSKP